MVRFGKNGGDDQIVVFLEQLLKGKKLHSFRLSITTISLSSSTDKSMVSLLIKS